MRIATLFLSLFVMLSCSESDTPSAPEMTMYYNGDIITMEGETPAYAEAVLVSGDKISYVGSLTEAKTQAGSNCEKIDLAGRTMVPGFIDGHAHFTGFGTQAVAANLLASPDGSCDNIDQLLDELKSWYEKNGTTKTQGWILGLGFDDSVLEESRFPNKDDLDKVSAEIPICIIHISGHFCVLNTKGLEMNKITAESEDPDGGVIRRVPGTREPNGVLEELAAIPVFFPIMTPTDPDLADYYLDKGQELAVSYGYTTAQEGRAMTNHEQMASYAEQGKFYIDVASYIDYSFADYMESKWNSSDYQNHYRIAGFKLTLDGSPQGRTAWRTEPYLLPPSGQEQGYSGYPAIPSDTAVQAIVDLAFENDWQLLAHCNGDAAADQLLRAIGPAARTYGNDDRRNVLIHGQLIRQDQLDSLKKYEMVASLFPMHTFYWGDWYKQIIGPEKAEQISPIKSALDKGLHVTSHTDAPVALPNLMMIMYTTVNRVTRSGTVLGPDERLAPYQALQSITIGGAYQHFEEDSKGTLTQGKLADLVILDQNPLKVDPMTLKDIQVLQTIKEGESVYTRH